MAWLIYRVMGGARRARARATLLAFAAMACGTASYTVARFSAARASQRPEEVVGALRKEGIVRIDGVLSTPAAAQLLEEVNCNLEASLERAKAKVHDANIPQDAFSDLLRLTDEVLAENFGDVLCGKNRRDLKLDLSNPQVECACSEVLSVLQPTLASCLGEDSELYELAALISDPQSASQPLHPDTSFEAEAAVLTAFVALQDIDATMGPTLFLRGTHTAEAHAAFDADGRKRTATALGSYPSWRGVINAGDVTLYDSRLLHCGGANESPRRRALFYVSFRAKGAAPSFRKTQGTLLESLRGRYTLRDLGNSC